MHPGPKPKPTEIAEKQGNPGHRPLAKEPTTTEGEVLPTLDMTAPSWLDDDGRKIWAAYVPRLRTIGFMRETDRMSFARLCDHTARWLRLRLKVNEKGESYTTESRHGKMDRINPDFAAMLRVEEKMVALEDRFGLTPAARQQILARVTSNGDLPLPLDTPQGSAPENASLDDSPIGALAGRPMGRPN